jgi:hypothetical protein
MPIYRSSGACQMWMIEFYKHIAPLALRTDNLDSNDPLFAHSSLTLAGDVTITSIFISFAIRFSL